MSTKSLTDDEIEKVKKSIDLYEKIIQELGGSSSPTSASSSVASASVAGPAASSSSPTPAASSASTTSSAVSPGPDGSAEPDTSTVTNKKVKKVKKGKSLDSTAASASAAAPAAPASPAASTLKYSTDQENIINDLKLNKTIFEELEKIRKDENIQPPHDIDGIFGIGAHKFTNSILSGLNENTGNNVWLKKDGFFVSKDGENYENQAIIGEPAVEITGDFNGKNNTRYYKFKNQVLGSLMQQGKIRTNEVAKKIGIFGGKTLKKRKGRSRKTKRK